MRIGFDVSQTAENKSGTGYFAEQLITAIAKRDSENEYTLFPWFYDYRFHAHQNAVRINQKNINNRVIENFAKDKDFCTLDIVHSNNYRYPKWTQAKKVVTIYDVCFLDHPEYTTEANRVVCYSGTYDSMLFADKIVTISEYSRQRLLHFFPNTDPEKVEQICLGNRQVLATSPDKPEILADFRLDIESYILSVGTIEPRKNYTTLLKAYAEYVKVSNAPRKLCIAGGYGWMQENLMNQIDELGITENVVITGYVSDFVLSNLYRYCYAFVYPSWYEGFGLPVLEAMNFSKPVITSNVTSIPEITLDKALLAEPGDPGAFTEYMLALENDTELYNRLSLEGKKRSLDFSWDKAAEQLLDIYRKI